MASRQRSGSASAASPSSSSSGRAGKAGAGGHGHKYSVLLPTCHERDNLPRRVTLLNTVCTEK